MVAQANEEFDNLYKRWEEEEWSDEHPYKFVNLARRLTELQPENVKGWCALSNSIELLLCSPDKSVFSEEEKEKIKGNPLFWEMVDAVKKEVKLDPNETSSLWSLAIDFDKLGLYDRAYEAYVMVAEIEARNPDEFLSFPSVSYMKAGIAIYNFGNCEKAVNALELSIEHEDEITRPETWYYLGKSYEKLGIVNEALEALEEAARLSPEEYERDYLELKNRI